MRRLLLLALILVLPACASQYSQHTKAELTYTEDGRPIFKLDSDKSYSNLKIDVTKLNDGTYEFHYAAEKTDANGAIEAVANSNAKLAGALGSVVSGAATLVTPIH